MLFCMWSTAIFVQVEIQTLFIFSQVKDSIDHLPIVCPHHPFKAFQRELSAVRISNSSINKIHRLPPEYFSTKYPSCPRRRANATLPLPRWHIPWHMSTPYQNEAGRCYGNGHYVRLITFSAFRQAALG